MSNRVRRMGLLWLWLILSGCTAVAAPTANPNSGAIVPTATLHPLFLQETGSGAGGQTAVIGVTGNVNSTPAAAGRLTQPAADTAAAAATATVWPTITPLPTRQPTPTPPPVTIVTLYDEELLPGWSLRQSSAVSWRILNNDPVYSGRNSISLSPQADYGILFFTVEADSAATYPRAQVQGISFWLFSPDEPLGLDDLSISILGSNIYPYWIRGDNSVENESWPVFSETRLEFLGFNYPIPPNEWTKVEVWLEDLLFDPDYEYVTGFYIKNDEGFYKTVYIDQVEMVMSADSGEQDE
jgi:hypothetical protein